MKEFLNALGEIRKEKKRKFDQSVELIINLKSFDVRRESLNLFVTLPYQTSEKKICAFLETPSKYFDLVITRRDFAEWQEKKQVKKLVKKYDFFVSAAPLMPLVATTFGKILGPAGKMPSPQLGVLMSAGEKEIFELKEKIKKTIRIKTKEPSIKVVIGKESNADEELAQNAEFVYNAVLNALPKKKENIKSVMLKFTMSKAIKIKLK